VDIDVLERNLAGDVGGHHHHARHPEEDDVETRDQHRRGQVEIERRVGFGRILRRPVERGERPQRRREPRIEHVRVARERPRVALGRGKRPGLRLVVRHPEATIFGRIFVGVPRRDLVPPPQLARNAPILDIDQPLAVGIHPVVGEEADAAVLDHFERLLRERLAVRPGLGGGHEPLVGEHGFEHHARALAARHHHLVRLHLDQKPLRLQLGHGLFPGHEPVEPAVGLGHLVVQMGIEPEDADQRQPVALGHGVVVGIVRRCHFHAAGAEARIHGRIGDDGNAPATSGRITPADEP